MRGARSATKQSLYKKARFVFDRDCRVARRAPRNDMPVLIFNAVCPPRPPPVVYD
ncbi:MAG: hypothetical protein LBL66_04715 [Clostridiales bacterium]|nr:hypothetical protein [Clostridiales bacterium]